MALRRSRTAASTWMRRLAIPTMDRPQRRVLGQRRVDGAVAGGGDGDAGQRWMTLTAPAHRRQSRRFTVAPSPSLISLVFGGRPQRRDAVSVIALGVRPPDFRQTAIGPEGDACAIIAQRVVCVRWRRSKRNGSVRRSKRSGYVWWSIRIGCVWWTRRDDGRIFEQAGRIVLRCERRACRQCGGERENAASKESYDPLLHNPPASGRRTLRQLHSRRQPTGKGKGLDAWPQVHFDEPSGADLAAALAGPAHGPQTV
jgi:hypothetical protein